MIDTVTARAAWSRAVHFVQMAALPAVFLLAMADIPTYAQSGNNQPGISTEAGAKAPRPKNDVLANLGSKGLWVFKNNTNWQRLDTGTPSGFTTGDLNGDGRDDVIYGLSAPKARKGTWTRIRSSIKRIDKRACLRIAAGDVNGDGRADLVTTFQGLPGTFFGPNNGTGTVAFGSFPVHDKAGIQVAMGDLQGDNLADKFITLPNGLWVGYNGQGPWTRISPFPPSGVSNVALGDINADGRDDIFIDRDADGLFRSTDNGATWTRVNKRNSTALATGDADGNGRDGVFATFPNPSGGLFTSPGATATPPWVRLSTVQPTSIAVGRLDNNAKEDVLIVSPSDPNVIFVRMNNTGPFEPLPMPPGPPAPVRGITFFVFD